ncbi:MAG TPA: hypothetical protein VGE07_10785, partial [Herpetosiphonaceae bacterium]
MARHFVGRRLAGRWPILVWAALACCFGWPPAAALACTPPPGGPVVHTVAERVEAAQVVLEGTVTAVTEIGSRFNLVASVDVHRYFKETGGAQVRISNFGESAACRSPVRVGDRWIIFALPTPGGYGDFAAFYLDPHGALLPATEANIREVEAALGVPPAPAPPPGGTLPRELPATSAE